MPTPLPDSVSAVPPIRFHRRPGRAHGDRERPPRIACLGRPHGLRRAPARVEPPPRAKGNGAKLAAPRRKPAASPSNAPDAHLARRRGTRDRDDENLRQAMRDLPEASIRDWAEAIGKSRSSVVTALHRLRDDGLADSVEGKWRPGSRQTRHARQRLVGSRPCRPRHRPISSFRAKRLIRGVPPG